MPKILTLLVAFAAALLLAFLGALADAENLLPFFVLFLVVPFVTVTFVVRLVTRVPPWLVMDTRSARRHILHQRAQHAHRFAAMTSHNGMAELGAGIRSGLF